MPGVYNLALFCNSLKVPPRCQDFTTGALKRVLEKPDMAAIIDLKLVRTGLGRIKFL